MNLTDLNTTQTAGELSNSVQNAFGVKVDITKLDLDHTQKLLLTVNEEIKKQRLSEDRHNLHNSKSYLAKIFIKENLEKHIEELLEFSPENEKAADAEKIPNQGSTADAGFGAGPGKKKARPGKKKAKVKEAAGKMKKKKPCPEDVNEEEISEKKEKDDRYTFDPKGMQALRILVGGQNMVRAKTAIEMAMNGKSVPAIYVKTFLPLINILDDIMRSGMANVQLLKNIDKRAKKQLGLESTEVEISERLRALYESQEDQAELLLASKDVVDRVQKAVDDLSKLRNEDLPPLLDAMRDELGSEMSEAYANIALPTLDNLVDTNGQGRETLAQASRIITGEEQPVEQMGADVEEIPGEEIPGEEEFSTADVAAGAEEPEGREERE